MYMIFHNKYNYQCHKFLIIYLQEVLYLFFLNMDFYYKNLHKIYLQNIMNFS
jgi:hypothetical protein